MRDGGLAENRFTVLCFGREVRFERLCARGQLSLERDARALGGQLYGLGVDPQEARALAYNCALLFWTLRGQDALDAPAVALRRFTLAQIAGLAGLYGQNDDLPFDADGFDEWGVCEQDADPPEGTL